jgi:hypothetical protein
MLLKKKLFLIAQWAKIRPILVTLKRCPSPQMNFATGLVNKKIFTLADWKLGPGLPDFT